jgi:hypothetical protein
MNAWLLAQALSPPDNVGFFTALLSGMKAEHRFVLLIIGIGCGTGVILGTLGIISSAITSVVRRRAEMDLKRDMIDRGMSAEEIAKVIESATPPEDATQRLIASWARKKSN